MLGGCHHLKREPWGSLEELNFPWAEDSCWCCCVQLNSWRQATSHIRFLPEVPHPSLKHIHL